MSASRWDTGGGGDSSQDYTQQATQEECVLGEVLRRGVAFAVFPQKINTNSSRDSVHMHSAGRAVLSFSGGDSTCISASKLSLADLPLPFC